MKTFLTLGVSVLGLLLSVASASASSKSKKIDVTASRAVYIAGVYDVDQTTSWTAVQQVFASSLSASLTRPSERPLPVRMVGAELSTVAADLLAGAYDAALIVSETLPAELRGPQFTSTRTIPEPGSVDRVFHLVMRNEDPGMLKAMAVAFQQATSSVNFRRTVERAVANRVVADIRSVN